MNANKNNSDKTNGRCVWAEALQNPIYLAAVREAQIASDAVFKLPEPTNQRTNEPTNQRTNGLNEQVNCSKK